MNRRWQTCARRAIAMLVLAIPAAASGLERSVVEGPLAPRDYWLFESGPVRPVALSHDGRRLYVANIPDGRLERTLWVGDEPRYRVRRPGLRTCVRDHGAARPMIRAGLPSRRRTGKGRPG
jgi:hypothetical protein